VSASKPIKVAVIGGGCASIAAAFELSRPEHHGKYEITVYQVGWRLGGKGASGRGPEYRIEEHGLHVWMGFYENAFRLLRECYVELNRDPRECRFADWRDAFATESIIGVLDRSVRSDWEARVSHFPPADGLPGDPFTDHNPFTIRSYLLRIVAMARVLLTAAQFREREQSPDRGMSSDDSESYDHGLRTSGRQVIAENIARLIKYGIVASVTGVIEALGVLQIALAAIPSFTEGQISSLIELTAVSARAVLQPLVDVDDEVRWIWEITDLLIASILGIVRFGLLTDPRGFDAIDDYECMEWLGLNGASASTLSSAMVQGLYDLAFAYEEGDVRRRGLAAGQGLRGAFRMFFGYRGSIFWKMRAGMGDIVFAPYYEVLKRRGVRFQFFHRLENVKLVDPRVLRYGERPYVEALEFDVQAPTKDDEYRPLIDVRGLPCWPSQPDYQQLVEGKRFESERWDFESYWDRRKIGTKTLKVSKDFDFVVLGIGLGAIPYTCRELVARDRRWSDMVTHCKTVATQAFQIWMREDSEALGWRHNQCTVTGFVKPFDTWADMRHLIAEEKWPVTPRGIAYFCSVLPDSDLPPYSPDREYPLRCRERVKHDAIRFLNRDVSHLWPRASRGGKFRWDLLMDPAKSSKPSGPQDESVFDSQFWTANVNPSDRYCLTLPGTTRYRISPLDYTYDNLTVAGDWTACGFNQGCVEAAVMSGRLAAHAISSLPRLEDIVGYDHP
jgi:uncharacterized protein with NAD-binding domain and iron-sulfur cluster